MYNFNLDYTDFFDIKEFPDINTVKFDFTHNCDTFLKTEYNVPTGTAHCISEALWCRMNDAHLHYHTPIHVMSILIDLQKLHQEEVAEISNAAENPLYHLAIWFHDAVYLLDVPTGMNEKCSADFMSAMMRPYLHENDLRECERLINVTAAFNDMELDPKYGLIMDLDILNFGWDWDRHKKASDAVVSEFLNQFSMEQLRVGRISFLKSLRDRGKVFRTQSLYDKFEAQAQENIRLALEELENES